MAKKKNIKDSRGTTVSVTTETLGLEKPLINENYDIDVHNRNMDIIDEDLKPIDDSYIIELFQHDGDTTNPRDYYTKVEADEKFASKEEVENIDLSNLATKEEANNALNKANEAFQRGDNVKTQLVDKLISEGLEVSTNNTFEELIGSIALGKKWASGETMCSTSKTTKMEFYGTTQQADYQYLEISNLGFIPNTLIYICKGTNGGLGVVTDIDTYYSTDKVILATDFYANTAYSGQGSDYMFKCNSLVLQSNGTIKVPTFRGNTATLFSWIAFE